MDQEGNTYKSIKVNSKLWMLENLRSTSTVDNRSADYYYPNADQSRVQVYGLLYPFETACTICPSGWSLPSVQDWEEFILHAEGNADLMKVPKSGYGNNDVHDNLFNKSAILWTKDSNSEFARTIIFDQIEDSAYRTAEQHKEYAFSVRCIKYLNVE